MSQNDGPGTERDENDNSQVQLLGHGANVPVQVITPSEIKMSKRENDDVVGVFGPK